MGHVGESGWFDLEDFFAFEGGGGDAFLGKEAVLGFVGAEREWILVGVRRRGHIG